MATKMKMVKVCGYRSNFGNPQSWWVDTGILIKAGNQLTIDATNPGSAIQTWPGSTGWTPTGHPTETNWHETLAYLTSELEVNSFALIGKIGRDGDAFLVGNSLTFTPTTSGTLFLACNDGVNFQDNNGFWNVDVTFEEDVQLAPSGYGSLTIYADRLNTSLVDDWGIILTAEKNLNASVNWNAAAIANVVAALAAIDGRIQAQTNRTFKEVFAGLELRLSPHGGAGLVASTNGNVVRFGLGTQGTVNARNDNRSFGQVDPPAALDYYPSVIPYGLFNAGDKGIENTLIHELGHIIANRSAAANPTNSMYAIADVTAMRLKIMPDPLWMSTTTDSPDDIGVFWENRDDDLGELVPDNFLNWVRNSYVGVNDIDDYDPGEMNIEQQRASAYWVGGIEFTDPNTLINTTSPGINGFTEDAENFADSNDAEDLLRSLGTGDPNPTCS